MYFNQTVLTVFEPFRARSTCNSEMFNHPVWMSMKCGELVDPVDLSKTTTFWLSAPCSLPAADIQMLKKNCFCMMQLVSHDKWVPLTTAWRVLRLQMEEQPLDMEGSCECIE
jgi:hypothetical protein